MNCRLPMAALLSVLALPTHAAGGAHEHGVARLDVAVEPMRIVVRFDAPLDALVGFEHAPRTAAERAAVDTALARLRDGASVLRIDPAAGCTPVRVDIAAPQLGLGRGTAAASAAESAGHAGLDASFEFTCPRAEAAGFVELALFEAFPRLQRLDVRAAREERHAQATLRPPTRRLELPR